MRCRSCGPCVKQNALLEALQDFRVDYRQRNIRHVKIFIAKGTMSCDTRRTQKMYAVVKFVTDSTYSEIPITWLIENDNADNLLCWWPPKSANCPQLIANYASPEFNTWECYQVNIIKYCMSLESARKHATDSNYETTDDERLGRGKRPHVPYNRFNSDDDDGEECQDSQRQKCKKKKQVDSTVVSKLPLCPENFGLCNKETNNGHNEVAISLQEKRFGTSTVTSRSLSCSDNLGSSNMKRGNNGYNEAATSQQEKRFGTSTVTSRSLSCSDNLGSSNMKRGNNGYNEAATSQQEKRF
ncbi:uncharacterized protein LOC105836362 isoform X2 [Monomorium pharaonis]|uniref:uncharacterized protein LOC105836362 isoform X2 n=2 Tax=Monomorium pharaonis TaxID=307658 RepID=UPI001745F72A|nr:uncharacterized protein LOC105836362 isoform X2 [Monomorium pharaonis]